MAVIFRKPQKSRETGRSHATTAYSYSLIFSCKRMTLAYRFGINPRRCFWSLSRDSTVERAAWLLLKDTSNNSNRLFDGVPVFPVALSKPVKEEIV